MTISSTTRKAGPYSCNGVTVAFPFSFKVFQTSDVRVVLTDASVVETNLTLTTNFTVVLNADQDFAPGGTVTTITPYATGNLITIASQVPNTQPINITNQGGFYPNVIDDALDRAEIQIQQVAEVVSRAVTVSISSSVLPADYLTTATSKADSAAASASSAASSASSAASSASSAGISASVIVNWAYVGGWLTAHNYLVNQIATQAGSSYICLVGHTSGTFSIDYAASKWAIFAQQGSAGAGTGDMLAANNLSDVANAGVARINLVVPSVSQVQNGTTNSAVAGGTADAITATFSPVPTLTDMMEFHVRASAANATTAPTFNPNALGALTIYKNGGVALAAGDIYGAGHEMKLAYRASPARYELMNPATLGVVLTKFKSANTSIILNGVTKVAHGLGAIPNIIQATIVCLNVEAGYSVGQEVTAFANNGAGAVGYNVVSDVTYIGFVTASYLQVFNFLTGVPVSITPANWAYVFRAWL